MRFLRTAKGVLTTSLIASWVVGGAGGYAYYYLDKKEDTVKDTQVADLEYQINQVGELVTAYRVLADVEGGKEIAETDIEPIQVPNSMATNLVLDSAELIGKHYRLDLKSGTALSADMVYTDEVTDDMRLFDIVLHNIPVGLKVGSFIDVRISLPLGEDFIAIPHRKVHDIVGGTIKVAVKEEDIHVYNSMLIDSLLYPGTQLYATEYIEGGVQAAADSFYPISKNILAVAQRDPNLVSAIKSDILKRRESLEQGLSQVTDNSENKESIDTVLERGKEKYKEVFAEASREYQRRAEQQAELERQEALTQ